MAGQANLCSVQAFVSKVLERGDELYRDLPWRNTSDPYEILVSEVMLQQTQVSRVERFWKRFVDTFPTLDALSAASTGEVLELWQGLGYNRRALALKRTADECSLCYAGSLPDSYDELIKLPGVGPATAAGVMAFAYQVPGVYLETNVRAVFLHEFFPDAVSVSDKELLPFVRAAALSGEAAAIPRRWNYSLLDYGAYLKATLANPTRRSSTYARQSSFEGSRRQKRSFILQQVLASPEGIEQGEIHGLLNEKERLSGRMEVDVDEFEGIVDALVAEGFFGCDGSRLIPSVD